MCIKEERKEVREERGGLGKSRWKEKGEEDEVEELEGDRGELTPAVHP